MIFQDRIVGLVEAISRSKPRYFTGREILLAQMLATHAAIAFENARLFRRAQVEIEQRVEAEKLIKTSLEEKEVLLKEIHHRVKNNLQIISSMLSLQASGVQSAEGLAIFRDSQSRIRSMALIHEKLYRSDNLAQVDIREYIQGLTTELNYSYRSNHPIEFKLDIDHYFLYSLIRTIKPTTLLETGVFHGHYTACLLKGIHDNYRDSSVDGKLISIDLPAHKSISESTSEAATTHLPSYCEPGWVIPEYLKDRWQLHSGDSRDLLPKVIEREINISLFFHDSLHTYSHMTFEFENAYPILNDGGYLMSHDVHWNRSFRHFARKHKQKEFSIHGFGIFRKAVNKPAS